MTFSLKFSQIRDLLKRHSLLKETNITQDGEVDFVTYDSRQSKDGALFVCKGVHFKEEYFESAKNAGFACYMSETVYDDSLPFFLVNDIRKALSVVSIEYYRRPSDSFKLVGITGTAGKTTTAYMIHSIMNAESGKETGLISTNETYCGGEHLEAENTTPESLKLQALFAEARKNELPFVTMEVSSQAYSVFRVYDQTFDVGIFMNIDKDHIGGPEHPSYEHYRDCKLEFIKNSRIVPVYARTKEMDRIIETARAADCKLILFDVFNDNITLSADSEINATETPDIKALEEKLGRAIDFCYIDTVKPLDDGGYSFVYHGNDGESLTLSCDMTGYFNIINACAAVVAAKYLGVKNESIVKGLSHVYVPGRMNVYKKDNCTIIVDYAHNRLTLLEFLKACRRDYEGHRLSVVIGAAGKNHLRRDDIAGLCGKYADFLYLTDEDPDFEDPQEICEDIASRIPEGSAPYEIIVGRPDAIKKALADCLARDDKNIIAILGKGSERFIKLHGKHVPCESDSEVVENLIK